MAVVLCRCPNPAGASPSCDRKGRAPPLQSIRVCSPLLQQHKVGRGTCPAPLPTAGAMLGSWGCGVASIVGCHGGGGLWGSWGGRGMRAMEVPCRGVCWGLCSAAGPCLGCCLST